MGYILIIVGVIAVIGGVVMLSGTNKPSNENKPQLSKSQKTANVVPSTPTIAERQDNKKNDTIVVERVVEKIIEKEAPKEETTIKKEEVSNSADANKAKGDAFEDFVVNLLADWRLKLLDRTQDHKSSAGVVAESSKNPDLHVEQKRGKGEIDYYIECKYRSRWDKGAVNFEEWQLNRYRQFQRSQRRKVLVALGVGGNPASPATLRIVPLDSIVNNAIREIDTKYAVQPTSSALVEYMDRYFTDVFNSSKGKKKKE